MNYEIIEMYRNMPESDKGLYNGKSIAQIKNNIPACLPENESKEYLYNCNRVIECQVSGMNLHEIEDLKNYNHRLIKSSLWFTNNFFN